MRRLWAYRVRGSALVYTLTICLLVGLMLGSLVMLYGYQQLEQGRAYFQELAWDNVESGRNLALYGRDNWSGEKADRLYASPVDSMYARKRNWGLYGLLTVTGVHGPARATETILYGEAPEGPFAAALYLADRGKPLTIAGHTRLQGNLFVPESGIRSGYVGRRGFEGKALFSGDKRNSKRLRPPLDYGALGDTRELLARTWAGTFEGGFAFKAGDSLHQSWEGPAEQISSGSRVYLNEVSLSGQIIVRAPEIWVGKLARLDQVLLFANQIYFESGFEGRVQAFATDTIEVDSNCHFSYPSALVLSHPEQHGWMHLGANTQLEGMVIHDQAWLGKEPEQGGATLIDPGSEIVGNVYVPYNLDLKGTVTGNVVTSNFNLKTPAALYENHLLDAVIQSQGWNPGYGMGLLQGEREPRYVLIDILE